MNRKTSALVLVLLGFGLLSTYATLQVGYLGIWQSSFANWGTLQVLCDLIVTSSLAALWMLQDARRRGVNAWPFVVVTLFLGSFGPLLYLLRRGLGEARMQAA